MARFCVATGYTPKQYYEMTIEQVSAIVDALNERSD
jgi:hypothetical protein